MKTKKKNEAVKLNLSIDQEFYQVLKDHAKSDFVPVATWTKQFLMKRLSAGHNPSVKCVTQNEQRMEN
jgi:hypothetical protein